MVLDDWDPVIAWEALWRGRLLWARDRECERACYCDKARAIDEVADLEPLTRLVWDGLERCVLPAWSPRFARLRRIGSLPLEELARDEDTLPLSEPSPRPGPARLLGRHTGA